MSILKIVVPANAFIFYNLSFILYFFKLKFCLYIVHICFGISFKKAFEP